MSRLLLFDIDCTLIDTGGAGMAALKEAACELFGAEGPELDLAGSTDSGIVRGMLDHFDSEMELEDFYQVYLHRLSPNLQSFAGRILPGVTELLDQMEQSHVSLGLLTGNIAHGAKAKIEHYGLDEYFSIEVGAYGDDHHDRNLLGPVALERAIAVHGIAFQAENSVVIGDTPKDVACGKAMGAATLAVATGRFSVEELSGHGADLSVEDLCDPRVRSFLS
ncbi:MAG: HAD hydrolase-like protein [Akkermansiaceae bacterium]